MREMRCQQTSADWPIALSLCSFHPDHCPRCYPCAHQAPQLGAMWILCHAGEHPWMFFRAETAEGAVERMQWPGSPQPVSRAAGRWPWHSRSERHCTGQLLPRPQCSPCLNPRDSLHSPLEDQLSPARKANLLVRRRSVLSTEGAMTQISLSLSNP